MFYLYITRATKILKIYENQEKQQYNERGDDENTIIIKIKMIIIWWRWGRGEGGGEENDDDIDHHTQARKADLVKSTYCSYSAPECDLAPISEAHNCL